MDETLDFELEATLHVESAAIIDKMSRGSRLTAGLRRRDSAGRADQ